jgi:NAD(P)-dependent dehydrogenase (short-subunit alcohol dehydrogenase family)
MTHTAVVAGVGPGLGAAVARRLAAEGCQIALLARTESFLTDLATDLDATPGEALAVPTDLRSESAVETSFETVREAFGQTDVLVYTASGAPWKGVTDITTEAFDDALATGPGGAFRCARAAASDMRGRGGTMVFTGATTSVRGKAGALGFSAAKFGVRGLAQSLAAELGPSGVHVAHVVLDGSIRAPEAAVAESATEQSATDRSTHLDPDAIAETYWHLIEADPATMPFEVHLTNGPGGAIEFV